MMARKIAPALVTGNCVVVKTSEEAPLACSLLARLWSESDIEAMPTKGTWSVLTGRGTTVGQVRDFDRGRSFIVAAMVYIAAIVAACSWSPNYGLYTVTQYN